MLITKKHLSRRTFLGGLGATISLPLLESMVPAQTPLRKTAAAPRTRLACINLPGMKIKDIRAAALEQKFHPLTENAVRQKPEVGAARPRKNEAPAAVENAQAKIPDRRFQIEIGGGDLVKPARKLVGRARFPFFRHADPAVAAVKRKRIVTRVVPIAELAGKAQDLVVHRKIGGPEAVDLFSDRVFKEKSASIEFFSQLNFA